MKNGLNITPLPLFDEAALRDGQTLMIMPRVHPGGG